MYPLTHEPAASLLQPQSVSSPFDAAQRRIAAEIRREIDAARRVLLHLHPGIDGDSLGSVLAAAHLLDRFGKEVTVIEGDSTLSAALHAFPGAARVKQVDISGVDLNAVDLFLVLDSASIGQISNRVPVKFPNRLMTVDIDHHSSNPKYGKLNLVVPEMSSTCELLYHLFREWGVEIDRRMAECLLLGIHTDSRFLYPPTSPRTLTAAAELLSIAPGALELIRGVDRDLSASSLRFIGTGLANAKFLHGDRVGFTMVTEEDFGGPIPSGPANRDIVNLMNRVRGAELSIVCVERTRGMFGVSIRSTGATSALEVASALARNAGGHPQAAGVSMNGSAEAVKARILEICRERFSS